MRDVAIVGFAQRQMEEFDGSPTCVELLVPLTHGKLLSDVHREVAKAYGVYGLGPIDNPNDLGPANWQCARSKLKSLHHQAKRWRW